jgi:hypothetical protein
VSWRPADARGFKMSVGIAVAILNCLLLIALAFWWWPAAVLWLGVCFIITEIQDRAYIREWAPIAAREPRMAQTGNVLIDYTKWLLKWFFIALLGLIVVGAFIFAIGFGWAWWTNGRHVSRVSVTVMRSDKLCADPAFPIFVGITNGSTKTIQSTTFEVTAHLPDHSTNVLGYQSLSWDNVIKPNGGFGQCYNFTPVESYKDSAAVAIFEGKIGYVTFKDE